MLYLLDFGYRLKYTNLLATGGNVKYIVRYLQ